MTDRIPAYLQMLQSLLPEGQAWNRERDSNTTALLTVSASELSKIHQRADDLIIESDPRSTLEALTDWEDEAGLPDTCTGAEDTIQERRKSLVNRITSEGGQSLGYFVQIAESLGYEITIEEFRPFVCGQSQCGLGQMTEGQITTTYGITDQADIRLNWRVTVIGSRVTWFQCGVSELGKDPLAKITNAADLECVLRQIKPAHTNLIVAYT